MTERYRVAVVGLGKIGWKSDHDPVRPKPASHVSAWTSAHRADLVAVCDSNSERMLHKPSEALDYGNLDDMLRLERSLDIVSVATPSDTHRAIVEACAVTGVRLIVCEKPLASTHRDAEAMVEVCQKNGTILLVNYGRRFHPLIQKAKADLLDGRIGRPQSAVAISSGGLWSGGSHMVDLLRFFLGDVEFAAGHRRGPCSEDGKEDGYDATLWFTGGTRATLHCVDIRQYVVFECKILGDGGALVIDPATRGVSWGYADPSYPMASGYNWLVEGGQTEIPPTTFLGEMATHAIAVLDGTEEPLCTGEDGLACVRILEAIERSGRANGTPTVP